MRPARRWAACCGPATPAPTPPPTMSTVLDRALAQIPVEQIETIEILVRADTAGATHGLTDYCRERDLRFSVGYELTEPVRAAILEIPARCVAGGARSGRLDARPTARSAEITDRVDLPAWPGGSRLIVRRERPHPGAQLRFTDHDGYRFQAILTDQPAPTSPRSSATTALARASKTASATTRTPACAKFPFKAVRAQRGLARDRADRARSDRLDPSAAARRRARQGRTQTAALPATARRRPARVLTAAKRKLRLPHDWPWARELAAAFASLKALPAAAG